MFERGKSFNSLNERLSGESSKLKIDDDRAVELIKESLQLHLRNQFSFEDLMGWRVPPEHLVAKDEVAKKKRDIAKITYRKIYETIAKFIENECNSNTGLLNKYDINRIRMASICEKALNECLGFGPIEPLFNDPLVMEIIIVNPFKIIIERAGRKVDISTPEKYSDDPELVKLLNKCGTFKSEDHCKAILERMLQPLGKSIDINRPISSARLPDGSRLMAQIYPISVDGTTISIRRFRQDIDENAYLEKGTWNKEVMDFLRNCVIGRLNIIVAGGTSSGKTTTLNILSSYIPKDEWPITIEDNAELQFKHPYVRRLEAREKNTEGLGEVTQRTLLRTALRMRPDRIVMGEMRGEEAYDVINANNTGHDGGLTTAHANSALDALSRILNMALTAGTGLPSEAIKGQIISAFDLVVYQERFRDGRRVITEISAIDENVKDEFSLINIFKYDFKSSTWKKNNELPFYYLDKMRKNGVNI